MPYTHERAPQPPDWRVLLDRYVLAWQRYQTTPTPHNLDILHVGQQLLMAELRKPGKFPLGQIVATPGALTTMHEAGHIPPEFLLRHHHGDWGELDPEDRKVNEQAMHSGQRLLSAYNTRLQGRLWVITEWDRSVTTMLTPEEY